MSRSGEHKTNPPLPATSLRAAFVALLALGGALSCGDSGTGPPVATTVKVSPATPALTALGDTVRLKAEVLDQNGQPLPGGWLTWTSSAPAVATVDASGRVTAAANGSATITATAGSATGTAAVTVAQVMHAVSVSPAADTLAAFGDTLRLVAAAADANGHAVAASEFAWASSDTLVARVDASGRVTAAANGSATITATAGSASGTAAVTVAQVVHAVSLSPAADTLAALGDTLRLVAQAVDANGHPVASSEFAWASSDTVVARVAASGRVTAVANGSATITATAGSATGTAAVTVAQVVHAVSVSPASETLAAYGDTLRLIAEAADANGHAVAASDFAWASSDTLVARVDVSGLVESVAQGSAVVTATASAVTGEAVLSVVGTACTSYFELTYADGGSDCIRVPKVVFTFTPRGGRALTESRFDPTEVVKIHFDSEVVYLSESGEWRDISKEDILDMVEISGGPPGYQHGLHTDRVTADGPIDSALVSVTTSGGKTVITIDSPYDARTWDGKIYANASSYSIMITNLAKRADVHKIVNSTSVESYLRATKTLYHGEFGARYYNATSCDIEHRPSTASHAEHGKRYGEADVLDLFAEELKVSRSLPAGAAFDESGVPRIGRLERADPATRYVIDVAFVVDNPFFESAGGDWTSYLRDDIIDHVTKAYQDSGVNVDFRVSAIIPFSGYRQYLLCDLPALDDLVITQTKVGDSYGWSGGDAIALLELVPSIRARHPADLVIALIPGGGGYASGAGAAHSVNRYAMARWESFAVVRGNPGVAPATPIGQFSFSMLLAHEIGHVLGLHHDLDTLVESGLAPEQLARPGVTATGFGYGYCWPYGEQKYGTIMSYCNWLPLFSSNREVAVSELCSDEQRGDIIANVGFCADVPEGDDGVIRLGGPVKYGITADATEALQYTIGIASEYSEAGVAPLDLSTVSNAVTAAGTEGRH